MHSLVGSIAIKWTDWFMWERNNSKDYYVKTTRLESEDLDAGMMETLSHLCYPTHSAPALCPGSLFSPPPTTPQPE